jgi:serine/threonine protein kinase
MFPWDPFRDASGVQFLPALHIGKLLSNGSYGHIYKSQRAVFYPIQDLSNSIVRFERKNKFQDIVSKHMPIEITEEEEAASPLVQEQAYSDEIQAVLYEAALHAIVRKTFEFLHLPSVVPQLYEVVAKSQHRHPSAASQISDVYINMEWIEGCTLYDYLVGHFHPYTTTATRDSNDQTIVDILMQLSVYLDILQTQLRFNHRDLKVNNVLIRTQDEGWSRELNHTLFKQPWICKKDLVLIDFGFSCIACDSCTNRKSLVQAGSWFSARHDCMKKGRDLALFLYCLECYFPLKTRISDKLYNRLHSSMRAKNGSGAVFDLWNGVSDSGSPYSTPHALDFTSGIYKFLRHSDVEIPGCEPQTMIQMLTK